MGKTLKVLEAIDNLVTASGLAYKDLANIPILKDYAKMREQGEKKTYIYAVLAERHHLSSEHIARICRRTPLRHNK